jgi:hypothetical protein
MNLFIHSFKKEDKGKWELTPLVSYFMALHLENKPLGTYFFATCVQYKFTAIPTSANNYIHGSIIFYCELLHYHEETF